MLLALLLAAPLLVAALIAGIVTGLVGAFTQIQDPAVGLVPRVAAVGAAIVLFAPAIAHQLSRVRATAVAADHRRGHVTGHGLMSALLIVVLALRGAAAVLVLTTFVGGIPRVVQCARAALGLWSALLVRTGGGPAAGVRFRGARGARADHRRDARHRRGGPSARGAGGGRLVDIAAPGAHRVRTRRCSGCSPRRCSSASTVTSR